MAHYAFMDNNNVVVKIITGIDENKTQLDGDIEVGGSAEAWESFYANQSWNLNLLCKRTSFNNNIRKQYAQVGGTYDAKLDIFISSQPYPSWTLDENHDWQAPTPRPSQGFWYWDEEQKEWKTLL